MAFNGSGTYSPPTPEYPAIAGNTIVAADFNTIITDIASALSMCLLKDGQQVPTTNLPMGGLKHTGVAKATARDQYASFEQLQDGEANFVTPANVGGTANAVTLSLSPAPTGYETAIDLFYVVESENTSEDVTHNLNAIGLLNTKKFIGGAKVKVAIGDLQVGMMAHLKYDGTDLVLMNPRGYSQSADVASAATIDLDACTGDLVDVTGTTGISAITLRRGQERTIRFTGALLLTHGASLVLPGAANITTAAGDFAVVRGYAAGVVRCLSYTRASLPYTNRQATTSGSTIDFTIPTGAKRITLHLEGVSTNDAFPPSVRLGDAGGIETGSYSSTVALVRDGANTPEADGAVTSQFQLGTTATSAATQDYTGAITFTLANPAANTWIMSGTLRRNGTATTLGAIVLAGSKSLSESLTTLRFYTGGTFDAGAVSVLAE